MTHKAILSRKHISQLEILQSHPYIKRYIGDAKEMAKYQAYVSWGKASIISDMDNILFLPFCFIDYPGYDWLVEWDIEKGICLKSHMVNGWTKEERAAEEVNGYIENVLPIDNSPIVAITINNVDGEECPGIKILNSVTNMIYPTLRLYTYHDNGKLVTSDFPPFKKTLNDSVTPMSLYPSEYNSKRYLILGRYLLNIAKSTISVWDAYTWRIHKTLYIPGIIPSIVISDNSLLYEQNDDAIHICTLPDLNEIARLYLVNGGNDWFIIDNNGYWAGSQNASQYLGWCINNQIISYGEYSEAFHRP